MVDQIQVPTYEQISTLLTKLATNYSNIAVLFYDIFYNTTPMDVTFQMYDESGVIQTYTIPNRAKDMANVLNNDDFEDVEGSPEGKVEATKGVIFQDLDNGDLYIKETATGNLGWVKFVTASQLEGMIIEGVGNPENIYPANKGTLYVDKTNAELFIKTFEVGATGWVLISANTENLANRDLSNLTANGEALFNVKENSANKVTSISSSSSNIQYPSAKAVYDFVGSSTADFANKDLDNLTAEGEAHFADPDFSNISASAKGMFLGNNRILSCVLGAPSEMIRGAENSFVLPAGTKLLCLDGLNLDNTINNEMVDIIGDGVVGVISNLGNEKGYIFYENTGDGTGEIIAPSTDKYFYFIPSTEEPEPEVTRGGIWFNPQDCRYRTVKTVNDQDVWQPSSVAEIGRWSTDAEGKIEEFISYPPLRLVNTNSRELDHTVIEIGGTEDNWYRLYKNGWIEAGGYGTGNTTIALNKNFKSARYTFVASGVTSYTKAVDEVTVVATGDFDWMAKGWVA